MNWNSKMLVEFSVKNFKSFKEKQTLSMVAAKKDKTLPQNLIPVDIPGLRNTNLLKSAVIYGANASGKSNLIKAFDYFFNFVLKASLETKLTSPIDITPFALDEESKNEPVEFEILFILDNKLHQYGFSLTKDIVLEEWLIVCNNNKPSTYFHRIYNEEKDEYEWTFSSYLKGDKVSISDKTRNKSLFLTTAAQLNHKQLSLIFEWIYNNLHTVDTTKIELFTHITSNILLQDENLRIPALELIRKVDLGISGFEHSPENIDLNKLSDEIPIQTKKGLLEFYTNYPFLKTKMLHNTKTGLEVLFEFENESKGTIKYYSIIGPLLKSINEGRVLPIDEFDSSIHPNILRELLKNIHHNEKVSETGFQLIFTTHDTSLIDSGLFRRDQIWFTEKNNDGESILYPLTDYKPRNDESLEKGYLAGRYGAVPIIASRLPLSVE